MVAMMVLTSVSALAGAPKKKPPPKGPAKPAAPADEPPPLPPPSPPPVIDTTPKPWAEGVPQDVQTKATALYDQGNELFGQKDHNGALAKYKEAIAMWEHPRIRFNMAVTEIRMDRILDAADDLEKALKYGDQPFPKDLYQEALDYQQLVQGRVGYIEVEVTDKDSHTFLDGKPFFDGPGKKKLRVLAGEHAVSGEKPNYVASTRKVVVAGGATASEKLKFLPLDQAVTFKYPYRRWIPWTMTGIGLAVGLGGVGTWFLGKNQMDQFEADYATQCVNGCEPGLTSPTHRPLASERDSAELKGKIGLGMMGVGGAVAVTGIVLAILNRPERVLPNVEVAPKPGGGMTAAVGWHF
jgi:hypothetical protein